MLPYKSLKKKKDKIRKIEKPLREALALPQWSDMICLLPRSSAGKQKKRNGSPRFIVNYKNRQDRA
jgi:hypothetical protein